jgi:hypothetical protein
MLLGRQLRAQLNGLKVRATSYLSFNLPNILVIRGLRHYCADMKSRLWQYTSIAFSLMFSMKAWAVSVTWDFAGNITSTRVTGTDDLNLAPTIGAPFSGTVTWDPTWARLAGTTANPGDDAAFTEPYGFTLDVGGHQYDAIGQVELYRAGDYAQFESSFPDGSQTGEASVDGQSLVLLQPVIAIDGIDGPLPLDPSDLLMNTINWQYFQADTETQGGGVFFTGELTRLTPVPEPNVLGPLILAVVLALRPLRPTGRGTDMTVSRFRFSHQDGSTFITAKIPGK